MFGRVFIANRGVVARRIVRACEALGVDSVAAYADVDHAAPHLAEATATARLPGFRAEDTYLNADRIIAEATSAGADALHPGYGFLAENADFARRVADAGLVFIGPSPEAISAFGEKTRARERMEAAGFPVAPGSGRIEDEGELIEAARGIGWPVMLKPAAGGGGIGMQVAGDERELTRAFATGQALARSAFGDAGVYLEAYLERPRHIEFQILGDGSAARAVGERECSVQRRHQKVIEEAPAPGLERQELGVLGDRAASALEAIGYASLGTVETLLSGSRFAFLEVNTRLQVEHGVTEEVTGIDLVGAQIRLAAGESLAEVLPATTPPSPAAGYAVQARIYAEDSRRLLPSTGTLSTFRPPEMTGVRIDAGYAEGQAVTPYFDPLLAKVIGTGTTREQAIGRTLVGVKAFEIRGIATNRELLQGILGHEAFIRGAVHTDWLESTLAAGGIGA